MQAIGLDIGTTGLCGVLLDAGSGALVRTVSRPNNTFLPSENSWEKLQDPAAIMNLLLEILAELLQSGEKIAAIGVTGQMHGILYLDQNGKPVSPLYTWQDGRGDLPFSKEESYAEHLSGLTGYPLATGFGAVTHYYNTIHGLVPPDTVRFCTIHDYAVMLLTGAREPVTDPTDAASLGLFDLEKNLFDSAAICRAGLAFSFFPQVVKSGAPAGKTPEGIPVSAAIGDNQASVFGSLRERDHGILINVGTGSQVSCVIPRPARCEGLECRPYLGGRYLLVGSCLCGGRAYAILERFFRDVASRVTGQEVLSAYAAMDRLLQEDPSPASLTVDTAFSGTRREPDKRGSVQGIGIDNLTMAELCKGVLNGMVSELYGLYRQALPYLEAAPERLIGSGNGIRRNAPLRAAFRAAFALPMSIPREQEEAAFGAALLGLLSTEAFPDIAAVQTLIHYEEGSEKF